MKKKTSKPHRTKSVAPIILSPVMRYENPGQLTVPHHLNIGDDGKLYLTRSGGTNDSQGSRQLITVKESVAWFRLGHDYNLSVTKDAGFSEWLKIVEQSIS
ncbi:MAG TPA: hypothetical protein VGY56_19900 [Verrucomicrobiae bacterium]|nr:hypothetical protein [Verrucomicrobiae bacterium]